MTTALATAFAYAGIAVIVVALWLIWVPLGLIAIGLFLFVVGCVLVYNKQQQDKS